MAGLAPVAFQALSALQTVATIATVVDQGAKIFDKSDQRQSDLRLAQLQQQQAMSERQQANQIAFQKKEIAEKAAEAERIRRQSLKKAVAKRRAQFGSKGIASGDGSSEAVLLGLFEQTEEEKASNDRLDQLRLQALDQSMTNTARTNVLKRTQLAERERLKNQTSTLDDVTGLLKIF